MSRIQVKPRTIAMIVLAALFAVAGFVYFTTAAKSLPAFFPGHDPHLASKHIKHGIAMIGLAALSLIGAWFTTAPGETTG